MRATPWTILLMLATACANEPRAVLDAGVDAAPNCEALFGVPNERTGLDETQCRPVCGCGASAWTPPVLDAARLDALRAWTLVETPAPLDDDPYAGEAPSPGSPDAVCAMVVVDRDARTYRLETFESAEAAAASGAHATHAGACGLCSTLVDLAVYASTPDLTAPVRDCGIRNAGTGHDALVACLETLGFTHACAQIWAFNTEHTREACGATCIRLLSAPYHTPDGALNECLECDEVQSGAVFKAVAGRTRRNSGLPSAMCRPCSEVPRIPHDYPE